MRVSQVRHKPDWKTTFYDKLFDYKDWKDGSRIRILIDLDLNDSINTTVEGRHGETVTSRIRGSSYCHGDVYLKFGVYRDRKGSGGTITTLVENPTIEL